MAIAEKRRSPRKLIALRAFLSHELKPASLPASVDTLNLSRRGALIESSEPMFAGEVCTFSLTTDDRHSAEIQGRIVWVDKLPDGRNRAGVAFRNLTAEEEYLVDLQLVRSAK